MIFSNGGLIYLGLFLFCFISRKEIKLKAVILKYKNGTLPDKKLEEYRHLFEKLLFGEGLVVVDNRWDVTVVDFDEKEDEY